MLKVRRGILGKTYMIDNGTKMLRIDESYVQQHGRLITDQWLRDAQEPIDIILNVEVGNEYEFDQIPVTEGMVITPMNEASRNWLVLTCLGDRWYFGSSEYNVSEVLKSCKWRVLAV